MKFCDKCGSMIIPKKENGKTIFKCASCGKVSNNREQIILTEKTGDGKKNLVEVVDK